jgi:hypothetical protein
VAALSGDTPGSLGTNDHASPPESHVDPTYDEERQVCATPARAAQTNATTTEKDDWKPLISGITVGTGVGSVTRIPVPGTEGLFIELTPRGYVPASGSTSTLFIQDLAGKRQLRLDYGPNKSTGGTNYHWNQKGTFKHMGIPGHTPVGGGGKALYQGARYFKYGGRALLVIGAAIDLYSIVVAKKRVRQALRVAAGWTGAWAGCKVVGAGGAAVGTFVEPGGGTAVGGFAGCFVGGIGGYAGASWAAGHAYDWIEETFFEPVPEAAFE